MDASETDGAGRLAGIKLPVEEVADMGGLEGVGRGVCGAFALSCDTMERRDGVVETAGVDVPGGSPSGVGGRGRFVLAVNMATDLPACAERAKGFELADAALVPGAVRPISPPGCASARFWTMLNML